MVNFIGKAENIVKENKRLLKRMLLIDAKPSELQKEIVERTNNWKFKTSLNEDQRFKTLIETTRCN